MICVCVCVCVCNIEKLGGPGLGTRPVCVYESSEARSRVLVGGRGYGGGGKEDATCLTSRTPDILINIVIQ